MNQELNQELNQDLIDFECFCEGYGTHVINYRGQMLTDVKDRSGLVVPYIILSEREDESPSDWEIEEASVVLEEGEEFDPDNASMLVQGYVWVEDEDEDEAWNAVDLTFTGRFIPGKDIFLITHLDDREMGPIPPIEDWDKVEWKTSNEDGTLVPACSPLK